MKPSSQRREKEPEWLRELPRETPFNAEISRRSYWKLSQATSWEEIWEAGPYYDRLSELLENAKEYAIFVGWQIDSRLPMKRPRGALQQLDPWQDSQPRYERLKEKIIRVCSESPDLQIYFLMWDHAYFYVLEREFWQGRIWENIHPRVHFIFDNRHPLGASHHEKIAIFDGTTAFSGGIDLCDERWDSPQHLYEDPRRSLGRRQEHHGPYHDLAVQVQGPICAEIQRHVAYRWRALCSIPFPEPKTFSRIEQADPILISRTVTSIDGTPAVPEPGAPTMVREVEFLFRDLIRAARKRIVLEGQYYWSRFINELLVEKIEQMRGTDFELVVALARLDDIKSPTRRMARYELELVYDLQKAAQEAGIRAWIGSPCSFAEDRAKPKDVYIHSKVLAIDDRYLSIGSTNFAARAFRLDTELQLTLIGETPALRNHIRRIGDDIIRHWSRSHVHLVPFFGEDLEQEKNRLASKRILWERLFDPELPWPYLIKKDLRVRWRQRHAISGLVSLAWTASLLLAALLFSLLSPERSPLAFAFAVVLSSAWILPIPYGLVLITAMARFGLDNAAALMTASIWVVTGSGYLAGRIFPAAATRYFSGPRARLTLNQVRKRHFSTLIATLIDPRTSLHLKAGTQGIGFVYLPWLILANWVVLPAVLYALLWLSSSVLPASVIDFFAAQAGIILTASMILGIMGALKYEERAPQSPVLQHPQGIQLKQPQVHPPDHSRGDSGSPSRPRFSSGGPRTP